jgi:hypothetical protein
MFPCFVCGNEMDGVRYYGWCERCQVSEFRQKEPYFCWTRNISSVTWKGEEVNYLDHSRKSYPSPG